MFKLFSKALGQKVEYVKTVKLAPFGDQLQYQCRDENGKEYLALLSDSPLRDFYFERAYKNAVPQEGAVAPCPVHFYGDAGGYTAVLLDYPTAASELPSFETAEQAASETLITPEIREQSIKELLSAWPVFMHAEIEALPQFSDYRHELEATKSALLGTELGNLTKENLCKGDRGYFAANSQLLRFLQPVGYDMLTLGASNVPYQRLNELKDSLVKAIDLLYRSKTAPVIIGDRDINDSDCPIPQNDFIYNRFDFMYGQGRVVSIREGDCVSHVSLRINGINAHVGIWLVPLSERAVKKLVSHIFENYSGVKRIFYRFSLHAMGSATETNHYHLVIPENEEGIMESLSHTARYDLRRKIRLVEKELGGYTVRVLTRNEIPLSMVQDYYEYKKQGYETPYLMPPERYLDAYHVTHAYVIDTERQQTAAMLFSCEQGDIVNLENLTYAPNLRKYTLGHTIYFEYIRQLIASGKKCIYLEGGDYTYKTRFGSVELITYNGQVWRSGIDKAFVKLLSKVKTAVRIVTGKQRKY